MATTTNPKAEAPKSITAEFAVDKDTKNTKRYTEVVQEGDLAQIGTVYVPKYTLKDLGNPDKITVTVTAK